MTVALPEMRILSLLLSCVLTRIFIILSSEADGGIDDKVAAENVEEAEAVDPLERTFAVPPNATYGGGT